MEKEKAKRQYEVSRYACRESFDFTVRDLLDSICDPNVDVEGEVLSKIFMDEIFDSLPERTRHILEEYCAGKMKTQIASEMNLNYYHLVNICLLYTSNTEDLDIRYVWIVPDKKYIQLIHDKAAKVQMKNKFLYAMIKGEDVQFFTYLSEVKK